MSSTFRYVAPVPTRGATGRVADVYAQLARDFGRVRAPVFMTLSPVPDLLAAAWSLLRESLLAGSAARTDKEIVAVAVSRANRCPFCVDAHTVLLHASGAHRIAEDVARGAPPDDPGGAELFHWAARTGTGEAGHPPFSSALAAEFVGTAVAFHFINRIASSLLTDTLMPGRLQRLRLVRRLGGRVLSGVVRRPARPGLSLPLLTGIPVGPVPAWGAGTPAGTAFAALRSVATAGRELLSEPARSAVHRAVSGWDGTPPPLAGGWPAAPLAGLPAADRPGARLALLVALAPYRITDADVAGWRTGHPSDADLVRLVGYGAMLAVERVEASIYRVRAG